MYDLIGNLADINLRFIARRSVTVSPPAMPNCRDVTMAQKRHWPMTGHPSHTERAIRTVSGETLSHPFERQFALQVCENMISTRVPPPSLHFPQICHERSKAALVTSIDAD